MTYIAGGYTATWSPGVNTSSPTTMGSIEDGFELEHTGGGDPIRGDTYGDILQDIVFRGGDVFLSAVFMEWDLVENVGVIQSMWPYGTTFGRIQTTSSASIGQLATGLYAGTIVLTKVTGPNASPTSLTAGSAILAPGFPVRSLLAPRLKRVPVRWQLLPYTVTTNIQFFVTA